MSERGEYCEHIENVLYHPCFMPEDCSDITDEIVKVLNNNGYVIVRQKKIDEGHREIENQYNFIDYLQAYVEAQQKKIEQLEEYREEMIQMFKNLIKEKKYTTYCAYADNGWSHEESTRKAREEVKAELELLQKVRKKR